MSFAWMPDSADHDKSITVPLCRHCKHSREGMPRFIDDVKCIAPDVLVSLSFRGYVPDLVGGCYSTVAPLAKDMRANDAKCGYSARWYEPARPPSDSWPERKTGSTGSTGSKLPKNLSVDDI